MNERYWPICGHSIKDHKEEGDCEVYKRWYAEQEARWEKYGPCPVCEYGLTATHNHPVH